MPRKALPIPPARRAWALLFWALVAAVTVLMLVPQPPQAIDTGWDKLNHVLAFAATGFAGLAARLRRPPALCAALLAWGAALELLQGLAPPRSPDPADWLADAVGVAVGAAAYALAARVISRRAGC